jgi:hypothetical protein
MDICLFLDGFRHPDSIATQEEWQALGRWIEETADVTLPLTRIWHLTHLVTYGWEKNLPALAKELSQVGKQQLPHAVQAVVTKLGQVIQRRTRKVAQIEVVCCAECGTSPGMDLGEVAIPS